MVKHEVCGVEIWEVSTAEAKALWVSHPADRHRLWSHEEVGAHFLDDYDQIAECLRLKQEKPGKLALKELP